jgi:peptide/nickel transport system permease protein
LGLRGYILKRLALSIPILFIISVLIFVIARLAPGDPVTIFYGMRPGSDFAISELPRLKAELGLDQPIYVQFLDWFWKLLHGDLGFSFVQYLPVVDMIAQRLPNTLKLMVSSIIISSIISIIAGVIAATRQGSKIDHVTMGGTLLIWSLPFWWYGLMLILIFSVALNWLPAYGVASILTPGREFTLFESLVDQLKHLILPATVLGTASAGYIARIVRASMLEVLRSDYITVARAKGLKERTVIYKHALRNALLPVVTVIGLQFAWLWGGSVTVEYVFAWDGIGKLMVDSALTRDYPLTMGITLVVAVAIVISILVTDILYAYIDPKIRY